jgi:hypothetical protein
MTNEIKNFEQKREVAATINQLVIQINKEIEIANKLFINVQFVQNPKRGHENAHLCAFVGESFSY